MSSEYSIHLGDKPVKGRVYDLGTQSGIMVTVDLEGLGNADAGVRLFVDRGRLLEASLLFHKIAQDLAALLPDVDACCRCVPGTPDDQCAEHGYGAFKIKREQPEAPDWREHRHLPDDPLHSQHGPNLHTHDAAGCVNTIMGRPYPEDDTIPIEEAVEHIDPPHRWG